MTIIDCICFRHRNSKRTWPFTETRQVYTENLVSRFFYQNSYCKTLHQFNWSYTVNGIFLCFTL